MVEERSEELILAELTRRAEELFGPQRAEELQGSLRDTARQLAEIRRNPPSIETEPGFYLGSFGNLSGSAAD